jgi:hypothetical protein
VSDLITVPISRELLGAARNALLEQARTFRHRSRHSADRLLARALEEQACKAEARAAQINLILGANPPKVETCIHGYDRAELKSGAAVCERCEEALRVVRREVEERQRAFLETFRGRWVTAWDLAKAMGRLTPGAVWTGCGKNALADAWARAPHQPSGHSGARRLALARIEDIVVEVRKVQGERAIA